MPTPRATIRQHASLVALLVVLAWSLVPSGVSAAEADVTPPAPPSAVTATAVGEKEVTVSWTASPDADVAFYGVYRNGEGLEHVPASETGFDDMTVDPGSTYGYEVDAVDAAGDRSSVVGPAFVTTGSSAAASTTMAPSADASPTMAPSAAVTMDPAPSASRTMGSGGVFFVPCAFSHSAADDPIVFPFRPGASHMHDFFGATSTDAFATFDSMTSSETTCALSADTSAYWTPSLIMANGDAVAPMKINAYYRPTPGVDAGTVQAFPPDLRIVTGGDTMLSEHEFYSCGAGTARFTMPGDCGSSWVRANIKFPSCWNGVDLDSPDHRSHVSRSTGRGCPSAYPVPIPRLTLVVIYPVKDATGATLSSGPASSLHADFWNTWQQAELERIVAECLNAGVVCGRMSG